MHGLVNVFTTDLARPVITVAHPHASTCKEEFILVVFLPSIPSSAELNVERGGEKK